jgi:hypothetical protein
MKVYLLEYLKGIGMLEAVPEAFPGPGKPLARGVCCLHEGADNPNGFILYADGFACQTNGCHTNREFGCNIEGLIRHLVYRATGEVMAWRKAWDFARANAERLKGLVGATVRQGRRKSWTPEVEWSREDLAACLEIPSRYYLKRGFRAETLEYFGVGDCVRPLPDGNDRLMGWAVVPVLERKGPLGYTARNPRYGEAGQKIKWLHGVKKSECLFNGQNASRIRGPMIICEGPGEVFRFHEGGYPGGVATLGGALSESQYGSFLSIHYFQQVYIAADADDRGREFAEKTKWMVEGVSYWKPIILLPPGGKKDFGEASPEEIRALQLKPGGRPKDRRREDPSGTIPS